MRNFFASTLAKVTSTVNKKGLRVRLIWYILSYYFVNFIGSVQTWPRPLLFNWPLLFNVRHEHYANMTSWVLIQAWTRHDCAFEYSGFESVRWGGRNWQNAKFGTEKKEQDSVMNPKGTFLLYRYTSTQTCVHTCMHRYTYMPCVKGPTRTAYRIRQV